MSFILGVPIKFNNREDNESKDPGSWEGCILNVPQKHKNICYYDSEYTFSVNTKKTNKSITFSLFFQYHCTFCSGWSISRVRRSWQMALSSTERIWPWPASLSFVLHHIKNQVHLQIQWEIIITPILVCIKLPSSNYRLYPTSEIIHSWLFVLDWILTL